MPGDWMGACIAAEGADADDALGAAGAAAAACACNRVERQRAMEKKESARRLEGRAVPKQRVVNEPT